MTNLHETMICSDCGAELHWRKFRQRNGDGTYTDSTKCPACRKLDYIKRANENYKRNSLIYRAGITTEQLKQFPTIGQARVAARKIMAKRKQESAVTALCNRKCAGDRKKIRDYEELVANGGRLSERAEEVILRSKRWIAFYAYIEEQMLKDLRTEGKHMPIKHYETDIRLHQFYGVENTYRAKRFRGEL